ncbi:MAG: DUF1801 domain-containing protein [Bacteroidetes bacterium]|nr:DUF1801 domain-containing protein [Bacteroidota bacterium]
MINAKNVDDFIATQSDAVIAMLEQLRGIILKTAPGAEELVSYGVPCYKLNGMLVGFGVQKKGISFYTMSTTTPAAHKSELTGYKFSGSTIHINLGQKIPATLIKKIIHERIKQNADKAKKKKKNERKDE